MLILMLLFSAKPVSVQASMAVVGGGVFPSTFKAPKSVCVVSLEAGPRSRDLGGLEVSSVLVVCRHL